MIIHPSQKPLTGVDGPPDNLLANVVAAFMRDIGLNPADPGAHQELADLCHGVPSRTTITNILEGRRGQEKSWDSTINGLVEILCPNRIGSANLLRAIAGCQPIVGDKVS